MPDEDKAAGKTKRAIGSFLKSVAASVMSERDAHLGDVPNEYYAMWLDPRMVYSCAWFENGDEDLTTAQLKKIDHVLTKIGLRPDHRLLDVDCGWGALVIRAAEKFGARCTGITQSRNQFEWATECVKAAGLADRVDIRLQSYADVRGRFDRITSLGVFECEGRSDLQDYVTVLQERLAADGVLVSHGITTTGPGSIDSRFGLDNGAYLARHLYPDDELPDLGYALTAMRESGIEVSNIQNLRRHCVRTLHLWEANFRAKELALRQLVNDRKYQTWCTYLRDWATAFERDDVSIYEIVGRKVGTRASALPWPGAAG
ncbi:SAM-dependent methyltransferase [Paraburkholderia unamae]|uniref:Cyclopropane fatty-acyl-phospholipid synthase-like methyltransferase n=1 Tax=Paraburkholderia unamae TaxID=219649 RepID=A0ABX5KFL2_9BURK|nr:cyclopropane-fatty-acyl-phospholipid synthase family protein [Paraburkholderia unamae]PVX75620.1 cyclopropane fatty-acyl-phospholipid synthase-like methyltransferase [Paraburkholderia unamae]RAR57823.1 cyclopropane fatty-acyl-phospholipid synthase-like methyltransferase [Paraburkholderia unamae]CAG9259640.1 Cyclopropane-fatty-acyl-phospholipid synthase [Paraburkholderia unamae]